MVSIDNNLSDGKDSQRWVNGNTSLMAEKKYVRKNALVYEKRPNQVSVETQCFMPCAKIGRTIANSVHMKTEV